MDIFAQLPYDVQTRVVCDTGRFKLRNGRLVAQIAPDDPRRKTIAQCREQWLRFVISCELSCVYSKIHTFPLNRSLSERNFGVRFQFEWSKRLYKIGELIAVEYYFASDYDVQACRWPTGDGGCGWSYIMYEVDYDDMTIDEYYMCRG